MKDSPKSRGFGDAFRQLRLKIPLTLRQLAFQSGVSPSHLGRIERGERFPSANVLRKIAPPLNTNINDLFIMAGYLPPQRKTAPKPLVTDEAGKLDPVVSDALSQEPLEVQRAMVSILAIIKSVSRSINLN